MRSRCPRSGREVPISHLGLKPALRALSCPKSSRAGGSGDRNPPWYSISMESSTPTRAAGKGRRKSLIRRFLASGRQSLTSGWQDTGWWLYRLGAVARKAGRPSRTGSQKTGSRWTTSPRTSLRPSATSTTGPSALMATLKPCWKKSSTSSRGTTRRTGGKNEKALYI